MTAWTKCPNCGTDRMPEWKPEGKETARACMQCGHVEERKK